MPWKLQAARKINTVLPHEKCTRLRERRQRGPLLAPGGNVGTRGVNMAAATEFIRSIFMRNIPIFLKYKTHVFYKSSLHGISYDMPTCFC